MEKGNRFGQTPNFESPLRSITGDQARFKQIVRREVRKDLYGHIGNSDLIGRSGDELVKIPVPNIELPQFRFGKNHGGVGQGEGELGDVVGRDGEGEGDGKAGQDQGQHIMEDISIDELTEMLAAEIELPNLQPLASGDLMNYYWRMKGRTPNRTMRLDPKASFREALKAQSAMAGLSGNQPNAAAAMSMMRNKGIARYRAWEKLPQPITDALVIYVRDISGSRTDEEAMMDRLTVSWIDRLLDKVYGKKQVHRVYIAHDTAAAVVDERKFFGLNTAGGTKISSAYEMTLRLAQANPNQNIFVLHFSDGENWSDDNDRSVLLADELLELPYVRLFGFILSDEGTYHDEGLYDGLNNMFADRTDADVTGRFARCKMSVRDDVMPTILRMFGKRKAKKTK